MIKYLKYSALFFLVLAFILFAFILLNPINILVLFNWLVLFALICYSLFIIALYLDENPIRTNKIVRGSVLTLLGLPIIFGFSQMFLTSFFESYWPVLFTLIIFQSVIGLMAVLNFFHITKPPYILSNITVLFAGLFALFAAFITLQKELNDVISLIYKSLLIILSLLIIVSIFSQYRKNANNSNKE